MKLFKTNVNVHIKAPLIIENMYSMFNIFETLKAL